MRLSAASREYSVELCPISSQEFEALMSEVLQLVALGFKGSLMERMRWS